jgi:hypothetical protein
MKEKHISEMLEAEIQAKLVENLIKYGWFVKVMHGCAYQVGLPDMFAARLDKGPRWIEVKRPFGKCKFENSQLKTFPLMDKQGIGIWILTGFDDTAIRMLNGPPNWREFFVAHSLGVWLH